MNGNSQQQTNTNQLQFYVQNLPQNDPKMTEKSKVFTVFHFKTDFFEALKDFVN